MASQQDDFVVLVFVVFMVTAIVCSVTLLPVVRAFLQNRQTPDNAITACCTLVVLVAPLSLLITAGYWVSWWLFYLGVAVVHLLPKRRTKLPKARVANVP